MLHPEWRLSMPLALSLRPEEGKVGRPRALQTSADAPPDAGRHRPASATGPASLAPSLGTVRRAAERLHAAWRHLENWEAAAGAEIGGRLSDVIVLLWVARTLGDSDVGEALFSDLIAGDGTASDPALEDMVHMAFALGASWAETRLVEPQVVRLDAVNPVEPQPRREHRRTRGRLRTHAGSEE
jgi:hypothetical protein